MFAVYYVAIGTVGDWVTGWTNDVLFGEIIAAGGERLAGGHRHRPLAARG